MTKFEKIKAMSVEEMVLASHKTVRNRQKV